MTITVSTTDRRSLKALEVLATADRWQKGQTKEGRSFWAIPSETQPGLFHMADTRECSCQDHQRRQVACKHMLAALLRVAQLKGRESGQRAAHRAVSAALCTEIFGQDGEA